MKRVNHEKKHNMELVQYEKVQHVKSGTREKIVIRKNATWKKARH